MKRKITVIIIVLCLLILIAAPASAAGNICFTAINNTVQPLDNNTMPAIIGGLLYIPCAFFSSDALGVYYVSGDSQVMLYHSSKRLTFDTEKATVTDQNNKQYKIPAIKRNGRIYVPLDEVCSFFGLNYDVIQTDPAPVVRFLAGNAYVDKNQFLSLNMTKMQTFYDAYIGDSTQPSASPTTPTSQTFENVTVFLSFYNLTPKNFEVLLNTLDYYPFKCCFFVAADEIASNADLLRRAAGCGHTVGIWLKDGTYGEYQKASSLLFEAAKIRTVLVSAGGDAAKVAEAAAESKGLVFWKPSKSYAGSEKLTVANLTGQLSALDSGRISVNISCTNKMASLTGALFGYLSEKKYVVRRLTEMTAPTYSIG